MDLHDAKHAVRQEALIRLKAVAPEQRETHSARLRNLLRPWLSSGKVLSIGLYAPLPHEVNLIPLLKEYPQHRYYFPRCLAGRKLAFHRVTNPEEDLKEGAYGIKAPQRSLPAILPEEIDLLLVPGVAFTKEGKRLGYGGGYYDRFIPLCRQAQILAPAFPEQILPSLPTEEHDLTVPVISLRTEP